MAVKGAYRRKNKKEGEEREPRPKRRKIPQESDELQDVPMPMWWYREKRYDSN